MCYINTGLFIILDVLINMILFSYKCFDELSIISR